MTLAAKVEQAQPGTLTLSGDLLFRTVMPVRAQLERLLASQSGGCVMDLSGVGRVDSSALSLWLACRRFAVRRGVELKVQGVPPELSSIARLVGVEELLQ